MFLLKIIAITIWVLVGITTLLSSRDISKIEYCFVWITLIFNLINR